MERLHSNWRAGAQRSPKLCGAASLPRYGGVFRGPSRGALSLGEPECAGLLDHPRHLRIRLDGLYFVYADSKTFGHDLSGDERLARPCHCTRDWALVVWIERARESRAYARDMAIAGSRSQGLGRV